MLTYIKKNKFQNIILLLIIITNMALYVYGNYLKVNLVNALMKSNISKGLFWFLLSLIIFLIMMIIRKIEVVQTEKTTQTQLNLIRKDILKNLTSLTYQEFSKESKDQYNSWLNNDAILLDTDGYKEIYFMIENIFLVLFSSFALFTFHWILFVTTLGDRKSVVSGRV